MTSHKATSRPAAARPSPRTDLRRRPMAQTRRIALFEREIRESLSRAALDLVMSRAEVVAEGQRMSRKGQALFEGSVMLTLDLGVMGDLLREPCDAGTARKLADLCARDGAFGARVRALATREVTKLCGERPASVSLELKITTRSVKVLVDVDVEAQLR